MIYHYTIGHICVNENSVYAQVLHEVIAAARARGGLGALMFIH
jgi:hypothetical protein